jgi:hypothetical protein
MGHCSVAGSAAGRKIREPSRRHGHQICVRQSRPPVSVDVGMTSMPTASQSSNQLRGAVPPTPLGPDGPPHPAGAPRTVGPRDNTDRRMTGRTRPLRVSGLPRPGHRPIRRQGSAQTNRPGAGLSRDCGFGCGHARALSDSDVNSGGPCSAIMQELMHLFEKVRRRRRRSAQPHAPSHHL